MSKPNKPPIINCHIHMFTGDYVPPYLAKTYIIWPLYYVFSLRLIISCLRWYYTKIKPLFFSNFYKLIKRKSYVVQMFFKRHYILGFIKILIEAYLIVSIFFYLGTLFFDITQASQGLFKGFIANVLLYLKESGFIIVVPSLFFKIFFFILILIFFKSVRNVFLTALKLFKILPGEHFVNLLSRYVQIGLFSKYKTQKGIYDKLKKQYPMDTQFLGLPMDMKYMKAGALGKQFSIENQMEGILKIKQVNKDSFHPFVFADPRRMLDKTYFDYTVNNDTGDVTLKKGCLMQVYLEDHQFAGIKIYPALGYYPFDEILLPLWKYCLQNNIPIMTHCIKGTIFYRGKKKKSWDKHQVFTEGKIDRKRLEKQLKTDEDKKVDIDINASYIQNEDKPLYLNETKNIDFCNNFTNPLNYLCLLDEGLFTKVINQAKDSRIKSIFLDNKGELRNNGLKNLKICFAHFGGDDQWKRFLESDRDNYTSQLILKPEKGIDFFKNVDGEDSPGKLAYIWKYVDWFTIISSMMLQYKNVYADISYILHDDIILPLLKQALSNKKLASKVLYGTDFYVVRNHKSDKAILADMRAGLSEEEFDLIARYNPRNYLNLGEYKIN